MPQPRKYTPEQRLEAVRLYRQGRGTAQPGERPRGDYTLSQIEEMTGVPAKSVWQIANMSKR